VHTCSNELAGIYVVPMLAEKRENYKSNNMTFDNLNLRQCHVRVNNMRYPDEAYVANFGKNDQSYARFYHDFLASGKKTESTEIGSLVSYKEYASLYPVIYFAVGNHKYFTGMASLTVDFSWDLREAPDKEYVFFFILVEKRKAVMNMERKSFETLKTL
jgi:hypothetical protein